MAVANFLDYDLYSQLGSIARNSLALVLLTANPGGHTILTLTHHHYASEHKESNNFSDDSSYRANSKRATKLLPDERELSELFSNEWTRYYYSPPNDYHGYDIDFVENYSEGTRFLKIEAYRCKWKSSHIMCRIGVAYSRSGQTETGTAVIDFFRDTSSGYRLARYWGKIIVH